MTSRPPDESLQRAAAAVQLSIAIMETVGPAEIGNEIFTLMYNEWVRQGRSPAWISAALNAIDDIKGITFTKDADQKWVLVIEWNKE